MVLWRESWSKRGGQGSCSLDCHLFMVAHGVLWNFDLRTLRFASRCWFTRTRGRTLPLCQFQHNQFVHGQRSRVSSGQADGRSRYSIHAASQFAVTNSARFPHGFLYSHHAEEQSKLKGELSTSMGLLGRLASSFIWRCSFGSSFRLFLVSYCIGVIEICTFKRSRWIHLIMWWLMKKRNPLPSRTRWWKTL